MNIASIIGPVDTYSAGVAIVCAIGATIALTSLIVRFQTTRKTDQQFELEKLKLFTANVEGARRSDVEREVKLGQIAANRQVEIARIESGMVDVKSARSQGSSGGD